MEFTSRLSKPSGGVILKVEGLGGGDRLVLHRVLGMSPTCGLYAAKVFINLNVIRSRGVGW